MPTHERYEFEVKAKGRAVLPAGLRARCGFEPGTRLSARPLGRGQALIETADAVLNRIWSHRPDHETDGVEELRRWRDAEAGMKDRVTESKDPDQTGVATLKALGIS